MPAHRRRQAGLTYIPEGRGIFPGLSVIDNLKIAVRHAGSRAERDAAINRAVELFPILGRRPHQRAGSLSGGEQQMLSLGRALAVEPNSSSPTRCHSASPHWSSTWSSTVWRRSAKPVSRCC